MISSQTIAKKNDLLRTTLSPAHGRIILTRSVSESPRLSEILERVRTFSEFAEEIDPYQEHDFGRFEVAGESYFWKIDYYDAELRYFQEDGFRVLTIMRASEY